MSSFAQTNSRVRASAELLDHIISGQRPIWNEKNASSVEQEEQEEEGGGREEEKKTTEPPLALGP